MISLQLPMPVRRVMADNRVTADQGKIALQRGPLVYCAEWADNEGKILTDLTAGTAFETEFKPELLSGITVIKGSGYTAIPYYAWANRGQGEMVVWMKR
jgi:DUF1680 family protein